MSESKINEQEMVGGSESAPGVFRAPDVSVGLGDKPKSRMKLDQGTEYTVGALKAMKSAILQAMLDQAKAQGKKWSDLPTDTPERIAYRQVNKAVKKVAGKADEEAIDLKDLNVNEDSIIAATLRSIPKDKTREEQRMMARKEIERLFGDIDIKSVVGGPMEEAEVSADIMARTKPYNKPNKGDFLPPDVRADIQAKEKQQKENWAKGNKDELLFEALTKKWTK